MQWPPKVLREIYENPETIKNCHNQCNSNYDIVHEFEISTNFDNLPDTNEIKCYFYCMYLHLGYMRPNSLKISFQSIFDVSHEFTDDEARRMSKLYVGCEKRVKRIKDPAEKVYLLNVCAKKNVNDVSIHGN